MLCYVTPKEHLGLTMSAEAGQLIGAGRDLEESIPMEDLYAGHRIAGISVIGAR